MNGVEATEDEAVAEEKPAPFVPRNRAERRRHYGTHAGLWRSVMVYRSVHQRLHLAGLA